MKLNFEGNGEIKTIDQSILSEVAGCESLVSELINIDYFDFDFEKEEGTPLYNLHGYLFLQFKNDVEITNVWSEPCK